MISIYSLTPAPWGDDYRLVESFENWEDATTVLKSLELVNIPTINITLPSINKVNVFL